MVNVTAAAGNNILATVDGVEYIYNNGDLAWIIAATALVWIMIPGLGFFYSGLLRRKSALSMIWMSMVISSVVLFQWFFWGFSLAFSQTSSNSFIGNLDNFGLMGVDIQPSSGGSYVPQLLYMIYQAMFAAITPVIACGAFADRARLLPVMIWAFCWSTIVYNPIAYGTWNVGHGWMNILGGLDFAGGTPVHISSGTAALAISIFLGRREGYGTEKLAYRPHNVTYVILGTVLLWFGWNGFNGGSELGANLRAVMAMTVTNFAAATGGLTWMLWDYRLEKRFSAVGFCSGAISGLVAITPASGYVAAPASIAFGVVAGTICNFATSLKNYMTVDDALDIWAAHAVGGLVGNILTAFFADNRVASFDGSALIGGGWINHHWIQLGYQLADSMFGMSWSFVVSFILLFAIDRIPGCHFRASAEDEAIGMDLAGVGEPAYFMLSELDMEMIGSTTAPANHGMPIKAASDSADGSSAEGIEKGESPAEPPAPIARSGADNA